MRFRPKYPIVWLTTLFFTIMAVVAVSGSNYFGAILLLGCILPATLTAQVIIRLICRRLKTQLRTRRLIMLAPALVITAMLVPYLIPGDVQRGLAEMALGTKIPENLSELHAIDGGLREYWVEAFFRCDPSELKKILNTSKFSLDGHFPSARHNPVTIQGVPNLTNCLHYDRVEFTTDATFAYIYTDTNFTFAYIFYMEVAN